MKLIWVHQKNSNIRIIEEEYKEHGMDSLLKQIVYEKELNSLIQEAKRTPRYLSKAHGSEAVKN